MFLGTYNILLLDEQSNFLDIHTLEVLEHFMLAYKGTIIFVTHDQTFMERIVEMKFDIDPVKRIIKQDM
ncbi:hypothetical protein H8S33_11770 [Ornithinibacillus sp. BX22]|uniref:ABC transporter ATP-binding protein n=1 Tax=Ornithinibacillus hominis TaxID=2763055 RepID=A0A923L6N2_9BACI|nr:hypothetical protein [Ornithinibacillus hominis]MBC5637485.1 hypothetical protein [Ornithinibacillus hominis]